MTKMKSRRYVNLFEPQCFPEETENEAIKNNMTIDYSFGHHDILNEFVKRKPEFQSHLAQLSKLSSKAIEERIQKAKGRSLLMTVIMLTGNCNANCAICYTDRRPKANELSFPEIKSIINQTLDLGSRLLYIPGEGEPTLDRSFWKILEYAEVKGIKIIMFTNGILFSNDAEAENAWGMSSEEIVRKLAKYPVYIYHKFWSLNPKLVGEMMNIDETKYEYVKTSVRGQTINIPKGLSFLFKWFPKKRIGIEVVVEKRNLKELANIIIPFISESGIKSFIEPIIHAGRCFGVFDFDPGISKDEYERLAPWLSRQNCRRAGYKLNIHNNGYLSYGMALVPKQIVPQSGVEDLNIRNGDSSLKNLYYLIHTNRCLVSGRYQINGCICEELNLRLARNL